MARRGSRPITIPSLSVSQTDGTAIKAQIGAQSRASLLRGRRHRQLGQVADGRGFDGGGFVGALRDMYNPDVLRQSGQGLDAQYTCATSRDSGGVHTNSGVPNHGYALIVDGGTYNGQSITGIGLTKAAHIYYRAQSVYQGPASDFADHADAIEQSCTDLTGANLASLTTGAPSGEVITAFDCAQVTKAVAAVELRTPPSQCNFAPLLAKSPPPLCTSGTATVAALGQLRRRQEGRRPLAREPRRHRRLHAARLGRGNRICRAGARVCDLRRRPRASARARQAVTSPECSVWKARRSRFRPA